LVTLLGDWRQITVEICKTVQGTSEISHLQKHWKTAVCLRWLVTQHD